MAGSPEGSINSEGVKSAIELDVRRNMKMREWLSQGTTPLTESELTRLLSSPVSEWESVKRVKTQVGWPDYNTGKAGFVWAHPFLGSDADEQFRDYFFGGKKGLDNFLVLFSRAPTFNAELENNLLWQINTTRPPLNRLFAIDPQLVKSIGLFVQLIKPGGLQDSLQQFDSETSDGTIVNPVITALRQAYMIYARLITSEDPIKHHQVLGYPTDGVKPVTCIDAYIGE